MAAPMEARLAVGQISKLLSCARIQGSSYLLQSRHMGFVDKLKLLTKRQDIQKDEQGEDIVTIEQKEKSQVGQVRVFKKRVSIEEVRSYKPPTDATHTVQAVAEDYFDNVDGNDDWQQIQLDNRMRKFDFLTRLIEVLDHDIPNMDLHNMNTIEDVVTYFNKEVKDSSLLEDLTKLDLPKNLHMNQEYIRFHPDTDKIYDGVSAFPGNPTRVMSVKFRRKYKGYDGGDPINYPEQFTKEA